MAEYSDGKLKGKNKRERAGEEVRSAEVAVHKSHPLDSDESQDRLHKLMRWRRQARLAQADNRTEQAVDEDFYDGIQMDPEDLRIMMERYQPPLVYNVIKNTINWLLGTERKGRFDYKILPRRRGGENAAKIKTKVMKYVQDANDGEYARSEAFTECVCSGIGWMEYGARNNGDEVIFERSERWRNMWYDHLAMEASGSDMRFVIREKWTDLDIAQSMFPDRAGALGVLAESVNSIYPYLPDDTVISDTASEFDFESDMDSMLGGIVEGNRERVKLIECWYRMPDMVKIMQARGDDTPYGALDGAIYRPNNPDHQYLVRGRYFSIIDSYRMTVRCAMWSGSTLLQDTLSPYNHNRFPLVPMICYKRKRDNMVYGMIRDLRDPQSDLNKRRSRALFLLTANRVMYETGAFNNPDKAYDEINRADMMLEVGKDYLQQGRVKIVENDKVAAQHVELARQDEDFIHSTSGITYENMGTTKRELSGKAIGMLQQQGGQSNSVVFDNYYYSLKSGGEIKLSLIEQFKDREEQIRIVDDNGRDSFIDINARKGGGEGEEGAGPEIENDITRMKDTFVMSRQEYRETVRMAMLQMMNEIITSLAASMPEVALSLLDLLFEYMDDLPNKEETIKRIRKINGQDAPEDEMTEEQKKEKEGKEKQKAAEQQHMKELQMKMQEIMVALKAAEVKGKEEGIRRTRVDAELKRIEGMVKALEGSIQVMENPGAADGADAIIEESKKVGGEEDGERKSNGGFDGGMGSGGGPQGAGPV